MKRLTIALLLTLGPAVFAQQGAFEVVVSGVWAPETCLIVPRIYPALQWFNPDRLDLDVTAPFGPNVRAIASADHRRVFGLFPGGVNVVIVSSAGGRTSFFTGLPGTVASDLTVAESGRVFVRYFQSGSPRVAVISGAGVLETTYALPSGSTVGAFTVASDGCTIYHSAGAAIARFNACTGTAMTDFAAVATRDLAFLPDGRVVLASGTAVLLYGAAGALERIIATAPSGYSATHVALSANTERLYVDADMMCTEPSLLLELDLDSGRELSRRELTMQGVDGIVAGLGHATIPTASETALLALAAMLAAAGVFLLKR